VYTINLGYPLLTIVIKMRWGEVLILSMMAARGASTLIDKRPQKDLENERKKGVGPDVHNVLEKRAFTFIPLLASIAVPLITNLASRIFAPKEQPAPVAPVGNPELVAPAVYNPPSRRAVYESDESDYEDDYDEDDEDEDEDEE
jgi:hypothetical protein